MCSSSRPPSFGTVSGTSASARRICQETVVSYQQLAQDRQLSVDGQSRVLPVDKDVYRLVVIDEAHAYRNVDNTWYAALDRLMGGTPKKLLLLTATPVNNSLWDLHNLFLLFGPPRQRVFPASRCASLVCAGSSARPAPQRPSACRRRSCFP